MARTHLKDYGDFEIIEDKPNEGFTFLPICVKYHGRVVDWYKSIDEAQRDINAMPNWMRNTMREIDFTNDVEARAKGKK